MAKHEDIGVAFAVEIFQLTLDPLILLLIPRNIGIERDHKGVSVPEGIGRSSGETARRGIGRDQGRHSIEIVHTIQVGGSSSAGNTIQFDFALDGNLLNLAEQIGDAPADGSVAALSATPYPMAGVSPGNHTVQTMVWSHNGTSVYNYNTTYQVYKP